jgi:hypothetical protein
LAHVIAHEIGHLLIPGEAHTSRGIMRARWRYSDWVRASNGQLFFPPDQVRIIRNSLQLTAQMPAYQE